MSTLGILLRQRLRRDRIQVPVWILSTGLLTLVSVSGIERAYGGYASRLSLVRLSAGTPTVLMLRGIPDGARLGSFTYFESFTYLALMAALMSTFLAVRHTRAEEESARAELIAATPAGRLTPTAATLIHGVLANLVLALVVAVCLIGGGLPAGGSLLAAVAVGGTGVAFLTLGMLAGQVVRTSRGANGLAVAAVLTAYLLRAIGDAMGRPTADGLRVISAWPSWLSPIGWGQQVRAYTAHEIGPILLQLALAAVCASAVFLLQTRRDSGASLISPRAGRAHAGPVLSSAGGLVWRLQWPSVAGWCAGAVVLGLLAGSLGPLVTSVVAQDHSIEGALRDLTTSAPGSLEQLLISVIFQFVGVLGAACATQTMIRMRQEESLGTAEILLTTSVTRVRWLAGYLANGIAAIVLVLGAGALASVLGARLAHGPSGDAGESSARAAMQSLEAALAQLPVSLVFLGGMAVLVVLIPRAVTGIGWGALGAATFLGLFGGLSGLPTWIRDLSPFEHSPVPAGSSTDWSGGTWMLGIAVAAGIAALLAIRRRELRVG